MLLAIAFLAAFSAQMPPPGQGIEHAMHRLAHSRHPVRVLVYGQSISKQAWWRIVEQDLRTRFPQANLIMENRSIGGYSTQYLIRTMEADILPFHPDLILFHDYGSQELYEQIIRWIRANTSAEILLQSDHVTWLPGEDDPQGARRKQFDAQEKHSFEWLPALARKYGLGLADIRGGWHTHLKQTGLKPKDLLRDNVHLNAAGEALYSEITSRFLIAPSQPSDNTLVTEHRNLRWRGGELTLDFEGNRVELIGLEGAPLTVHIDGRSPASDSKLYYHSRPTNTWDADWPTVMRIGNSAPLRVEEWLLKATKKRNESGTEFDYEVFGSLTGPDGNGNSLEPFISKSGRVTINPKDFDIARSYGLHKIAMPNDWQVRWTSLPRFQDPVLPQPGAQTILYGLTNAKHRLTFTAPRGTKPKVGLIRTFRPAAIP
jgi:hypothetical protein